MTTKATTKEHIALIVPAAKSSKTDARDINHAIERTINDLAKAAHPHVIHILANGKLSTSYAHKAAAAHPAKITIKTHSPQARRPGSRINNRAIYRTVGNIAATVDTVIVLEGNKRAVTNPENDLINRMKQAGKTVLSGKITPAPTPENEQPRRSRPPLPEANYRINIYHYPSLHAVYQDPNVRGIDPAEVPIYCGRANKKKNAPASPLQNPFYKGSSAQNIARFRTYLWKWIKAEKSNYAGLDEGETAKGKKILATLRKVTPTTPLVCFCHNRKPCHTDIIRKAAAYIKQQDAAAAIATKITPPPSQEKKTQATEE